MYKPKPGLHFTHVSQISYNSDKSHTGCKTLNYYKKAQRFSNSDFKTNSNLVQPTEEQMQISSFLSTKYRI